MSLKDKFLKLIGHSKSAKQLEHTVDFGEGLIAKELLDGRWLLKSPRSRNRYVDIKSPACSWTRGDSYFHDCYSDLDTIKRKIDSIRVEHLGLRFKDGSRT